jgi:DNA-binding transcriptional MerR regulator
MIKIGDFSRIGRVTVKTLRFYDDLGLLRPARVDQENGYRYYTLDQLPRLHRILALRELGFTLDQMPPLLNRHLSTEELRGMLMLKRAEIERRRDEENERLQRVEARLRLIESEDQMMGYDVIVKEVPAQAFASAREVVGTVGEMPARCQALCAAVSAYIGQNGLKTAEPWRAVYYNPEYTETDIDVEMGVPVEASVEGLPDEPPAPDRTARLRTLSAGPVASVVHSGSYEGITAAYGALGKWIEVNGYQMTGPCREIYLVGPPEGEPVTEIQFPISKLA